MLVVTGDTFIGLAIIRSLGRQGLRVLAASDSSEGIGPYSRFCAKAIDVRHLKSAPLEALLPVIAENHVTHVIATSEDMIVSLNENRQALDPGVKLMFPPREIFDLALYKDRTLELAARAGVPTPRTVALMSLTDLEQCRSLIFPVVLKPRHRDRRLGNQRVLPFKVSYADHYAELARQVAAFSDRSEFPLVQEFFPGAGVGVEVLMHKGEPSALFQHLRIREDPPSGGTSVFCESVTLSPKLADYSVRLLQAMQWEGVAMVEYRYDAAADRAVLMEVNGRFWGSLPLALHAGIDFPYLLYRSTLEGLDAAPPRPYKVGVKCRLIAGDTKWLYSVLASHLRPPFKACIEYLSAFRPGVKYYGWSLDDPMPAIMNFVLRLRALLASSMRRISPAKASAGKVIS